MLTINNLYVSINNKPILRGINLSVASGELHAIMGPNGSGKSTLANILAGQTAGYDRIQGEIIFNNEDLLTLTPDERATKGLFLAFQYPTEIPGVNNLFFLKTALNCIRKKQNLPEVDAFDFLNLVKEKLQLIDLEENFLNRPVNVGFSGGEKKRNEILQMLILEPKLAILDEPDSGLDIDALQLVAKGINAFRSPSRSMILVTHYQRLLNYVAPDQVHVLSGGKIISSGTKELAQEIEQKGYGWLEHE